MKKLILYILLLTQVIANEDKSSTEAFLLKLGISSLINDFEYEKQNINQNSQDIESLKRDIKYLMQENLKLKLNIKDDILIEQKVVSVIQKKKEITTKMLKLRVAVPKTSIKNSPYEKATIIRYIYKDEILIFENCNDFGWCKIKNKNEYIPKFKLSDKRIF